MTQAQALEILKSGVNVFLTGEPGAGKSFIIEQFIKWLSENRKTYAVTASTGIAAIQIGGTTIHSWSKLGIKTKFGVSESWALKNDDWAMRRIRPVKTLIIDEVSMLDANFINNLDLSLQAAHNNVLPFGGIQIIFVGDFFQLPPVTRGKEIQFAFEAESWNKANLTICYLTEQHRQSEGMFLELLRSIREGNIDNKQKQILIDTKNHIQSETELYTHNIDADRINRLNLSKIDSPLHTYRMKSSGNRFIISSLMRNCLSPEILELKVGAIVMFTKNNFNQGFVNGTIGKVISFQNDMPVIVTTDGMTIKPDKAKWLHKEENGRNTWIKQLPLKLAWAITVHKSQGMSLDTANIDLRQAFEYGQGYVAISRVRSLTGLHLKGINESSFIVHPKVIKQEKIFAINGK